VQDARNRAPVALALGPPVEDDDRSGGGNGQSQKLDTENPACLLGNREQEGCEQSGE
jgi:hypothetical protein